jgi:hypothetical protein
MVLCSRESDFVAMGAANIHRPVAPHHRFVCMSRRRYRGEGLSSGKHFAPLPQKGRYDRGPQSRMSGRGEIEFWFDFGSAYAYFASLEIEDLAARHGRLVAWRPFMLGTAFKLTGAKGLSSTPLKKDYSVLDWERIARLRRAPFNLPPHHPPVALAATRVVYAVERGPRIVHGRLCRRARHRPGRRRFGGGGAAGP